MFDLTILLLMGACALVPCSIIVRLITARRLGAAFSAITVIVAAIAYMSIATATPAGPDPIQAIGIGLVVLLPAFAGGLAGLLIGWVLVRKDTKD